jgi:ubiquinone/menaquinone biosynthesis C-methylase UbiE
VEVKEKIPAWLDESHPNYKRWKRARALSIERGKFVYSIVKNKINVKNLTVLDLGSGEGGTSKVFSEDNFVVSFDLSLTRLKRQKVNVISSESSSEKSSTNNRNGFLSEFIPISSGLEMTNKNLVNGNALQLPFIDQSFDLLIIQDVIEHLPNSSDFYSEIKRILKSNGYIYLSTPNKFSILNILNDPHFGLPFISILKRESIKKYFLKYFRKDDYNRADIAQLFSLTEIAKLFRSDFDLSLYTKFSVQELFDGNKGIVWSDFHLKLITFCKIIKLDWIVNKLANDNFGAINKYFTPTFYIALSKK